jgi:pimeloyl-ACP methyl ester carboxylesterase
MKNSSTTKGKVEVPFVFRYIRFVYQTLGRLFPEHYGNRAYEQWFTTTRFKTPAYEQPALDTAHRETVIVNDLPIVVYIWQRQHTGYDKTVLFIHGWTGRGTQVINYIDKLNTAGFRVISFDGPAHGASPGRQTSVLEMTDTVLALGRHYGKIDAAITHSFGGMILAYAMSLGLKIERAAMICPPKNITIILDNFQRILRLPESVMQVMIRKSYATHGQVTNNAVDMVNNLKTSSCKGLVIHDEDDTDISWHSGQEIADAWPGARFIKTSGLGHRRIIHDREVIKHITDFLKDDH